MQYRQVPKNGDRLSVLGFGAMRLPTRRGKIDEARALRQIRSAIDAGVNYIDTAAPYHGGESERFIGRALADGYRERVNLATKLPPWNVKCRQDMDRILDIQLKKLQTDHFDYYLLHSLDGASWKQLSELGVLDFLDAAKTAGKIVNPAFSFHGERRTFKEIIDAYDWVACLMQYNFLDEETQAGTEGLHYAASKRVAVFVMEPLRGGTLAGSLPKHAKEVYQRASQQRSAAEWALRWVWNHPEVTMVLSGMNEEAHIAENIRACEDATPNSMSAAELATIEAVAKIYRERNKIGCTSCGYCMPCPAGVNVPRCFSVYNDYSSGDNRMNARGMYAFSLMSGMTGKRADAALCKQCKKCVEACPQSIDIPTELGNVHRTLGGLRTKMLMPLVRMMFSTEVKE